jgi:hypothetical protein
MPSLSRTSQSLRVVRSQILMANMPMRRSIAGRTPHCAQASTMTSVSE